MVKRISVLLLFFSLLPSAFVNAQETSEPLAEVSANDGVSDYLSGSINILYRFRIEDDFYFLAREAGVYVWDSYTGAFPSKEFWAFSIESYLNGADNIAHVFRYDNETEAADPLAEAASRNIPVFADIYVSGNINDGTATVRYTFTDLFSSLHALDKTFTEALPTEDDLLFYYWLPIKTDLADFIKPILKPLFTLYAPAGTSVSGFSEESLVIPESGSISFALPLPGVYKWTMSHEKYVTRTGIFFADKDRNEFALPAQKFYPSSLDIGVFLACFPEIWYTRNFRTSGWFFSVGLQQQAIGFFSKSGEASGAASLQTSFTAAPLVMPGVAGGYRFKTQEPYIPKLYIQGVLQARINYTHIIKEDADWKSWWWNNFQQDWFDDFSPASFSLYIGYDWETPIFLKLFVEVGASMYFLRDGYKSSVSKGMNDKGFLQQAIGDIVYFELPSFRLGVRIKLPF
ncbi:MAG: hypothetical protein LBH85_07995 [Treponema sp.]|jgi:hypothetical protein|nr:hypothetical protein [Treponema sp.]